MLTLICNVINAKAKLVPYAKAKHDLRLARLKQDETKQIMCEHDKTKVTNEEFEIEPKRSTCLLKCHKMQLWMINRKATKKRLLAWHIKIWDNNTNQI